MEENAEEDDIVSGYRYLLTLHIQNLTIEKVEEIKREVEKKSGEVIELEHTTPTRIWLNDLDALEKGLDEVNPVLNDSLKRIFLKWNLQYKNQGRKIEKSTNQMNLRM